MKLKRLLSLAMLCVAGWTENAYAYEVDQDITASVQKEWTGKTGNYQSKYTERYSQTAYSSGKILYMSIDNLESKGYYEVQFYAVSSMARHDFQTGIGIAKWYVNGVSDDMNVIKQDGCTPENETNLRKATVYVENGKLEFGIRNKATGGNWYVTHLKSIVYKGMPNASNPIDLTSTHIKNAGFETGTTDGWSTIGSIDTGARSTTDKTYKTEGSQGNWLFNTWDKGTPCTQTITKLPAGKYELSAKVASDGATIYMINGTNSDDYAYVETTETDQTKGKTLSKEFLLSSETSDYKIGVVGGAAGGAAGEHKQYVAEGGWWYKADNFQLKYYGNNIDVHAIKKDLGTPIRIEANVWYAFPININTDYVFTIREGNIIYTQDGTQDFSTATGTSVTNPEKHRLTKGMVYIKSATANIVTLTSAVDSYDLGKVVTNVADNSYIQNGTISFTYPNQISTKKDAVTELVDGAKVTVNGKDATVTKTDKGFELSIAPIEAGKDYVINVPAGIYGYTGHAMNEALTITLHTPAIFDGTYYFYNNDNQKYLSRGGNYATQAIVDEYGIAIIVKTDAANNTELKPFDNYLNLGYDGNMYTDVQGNNIRKFNATKVDGGYKFLNTTNKKYLATNNGQVVNDAVDQATSNIWTIENVNDHLTAVKANDDLQAKAAAISSGIEASTKAELENALKAENIHSVNIDIQGTKDAVQENYQGGASSGQTSVPLDIFAAETVTGLRPGLYKLSVNAFQRATWFNDVMNAGGARGKVYVYANDAKTQLKSIAEEYSDKAYTEGWNPNSELGGKNYPNSKGAANQAFAKNMYVNDVYVYVKADEGSETGTLKFGIQNPTRLGNDKERGAWTCYNNFTLTYYSQKPDEIVGGVHYYYGTHEAPEFEVTNDVPVVDATNATVTNATIKRTNPNGIVYLAEGSTADNGSNVVVGQTCNNLELTDGYTFTATKNFEATKATYTMTAIATSTDKSYGTIMLPYAIKSLPNGAKAYTLEDNVGLEENIHATEVSTIAANTPVIVTAKGTYSADNVDIAATKSTYENGQLVGTYKAMEAIENSYVLQKHKEHVAFYLVNNTKPTVKPFRAYIKSQPTNAKQFIKVVFDGETTGIQEITSDNTKAEIFDICGRRVAKVQKGVYIVNGKKVIKN